MSQKIGPGHPPISGRFRKGQSGNPKGRPRKKDTSKWPFQLTPFDMVMANRITITRNGVTEEVGPDVALQHRIYQRALDGDRGAEREDLKWISKRENARFADLKPKSEYIQFKTTTIQEQNPRNANEAMVILGIASYAPSSEEDGSDRERVPQLESWAVQMALSRRRSRGRLSSSAQQTIASHTKDAESIRWPRSAGK